MRTHKTVDKKPSEKEEEEEKWEKRVHVIILCARLLRIDFEICAFGWPKGARERQPREME